MDESSSEVKSKAGPLEQHGAHAEDWAYALSETGYKAAPPHKPNPSNDMEPLAFVSVPESERQKQIEKRKEQNRLAQRKFRAQNKIKIKELQEKHLALDSQNADLKISNEAFKKEQEDLKRKIQALVKETEELKRNSRPTSPDSSWWQFPRSQEFDASDNLQGLSREQLLQRVNPEWTIKKLNVNAQDPLYDEHEEKRRPWKVSRSLPTSSREEAGVFQANTSRNVLRSLLKGSREEVGVFQANTSKFCEKHVEDAHSVEMQQQVGTESENEKLSTSSRESAGGDSQDTGVSPQKRKGRPRRTSEAAASSNAKTGAIFARSKTACINCRARKKKCDEGKPVCVNCARNGILCEGYSPEIEWQPGKLKKLTGPSFFQPTIEPFVSVLSNFLLRISRRFFEPALEAGKRRVRWKCRCGYESFDDFEELLPGGADEWESYMRSYFGGENRPTSTGIWIYLRTLATSSTSIGRHQGDDEESRPPQNSGNPRLPVSPSNSPASRRPTGPFMLLAFPYRKWGSRLWQPHVDKNSDRAFFQLLQTSYFDTKPYFKRLLSLKTIKSVKFVQFELHQSGIVDVDTTNPFPGQDNPEYQFDPNPPKTNPPVGENFLIHMISHPEEACEGKSPCSKKIPKRREKLQTCNDSGVGLGWGLHFVEGWDASLFWLVAFALSFIGATVFFVCWAVLRKDAVGASNIAGTVVALMTILIGSLQAIVTMDVI